MNELTIALRSNEKRPLYEQIYAYIKEHIQNGILACEEKLPSTRMLAKHLDVSRSTVELAYEQLLSEGYIESRPCKGYYVSSMEGLFRLDKALLETEAVEEKKEEQYFYDFTPNGLDLNSFPYSVWRKLSKEILMDDKTELFRVGHPQGEVYFRQALCDYLYQARGVHCVPGQVIIGAGSDYLLMLLSMLFGKEQKIAVENPTYKQAYRLFLSQEYEVCPVEMDGQGMRVDLLEESGAAIAYVTPSHQYPTGIVMPVKRRMELLKWAEERSERYIIEDDYDSEFRYKGKPIPALQGFDRKEKVIYLGTFSKSIAPAIRLSYMVLPQELLAVYDKKCRFLHSTVSKVDQLIVQRFIQEGYYERHLNKTRALYRGRHDALINGLKPLQNVCKISGENAGVHLLLRFENGKTETELIEKAKAEGIKVYGMSDYVVGKTKEYDSTILLGYANITEEKIQEACLKLCEIWK